MCRATVQSGGRTKQRIELVSIGLSGAVRDLAKLALSGLITLKDKVHTRTENNEVSRPLRDWPEPGPHVFAKDVVLDDRGEPCSTILGRHECR